MGELIENDKKKLVKALEWRFFEYLDRLDPAQIQVYEKDDGKYSSIKYTVLPKGTRLRFRSHRAILWLENRPIWADYSQLLGKPSFLNEDEDYSKGMEFYFGPYMNTIELLKDMTIIHFPVDYTKITAPDFTRINLNFNKTRRIINKNRKTYKIRRGIDFTAEMEGLVRTLCVKQARNKYKKFANKLANYDVSICRDGYTLDFFYRFAGHHAKRFQEMKERLLAKMEGWREICLTNVTPKTVRLVESVFKPVA